MKQSYFFNLTKIFPLVLALSGCSLSQNNLVYKKDSTFLNINIISKNAPIQFVLAHEMLPLDPYKNYNWNYQAYAKLGSEQSLANQGYSVIHTGWFTSNTNNTQQPQYVGVIRVIPTELQQTVKQLKQIGSKNNYTLNYYMSLYRILTSNSSLLKCETTSYTINICIAPKIITDAQEIYRTHSIYIGPFNTASYISLYLAKSALTNFPNTDKNDISYKMGYENHHKD